jgi:hypothetical protein
MRLMVARTTSSEETSRSRMARAKRVADAKVSSSKLLSPADEIKDGRARAVKELRARLFDDLY